MKDQIKTYLQRSVTAKQQLLSDDQLIQVLEEAIQTLVSCYRKESKLLLCGNGGSTCDAIHMAEELTGKYQMERPPLAAIPLTDAAHITCTANDYGFESIFERGVEALGKTGDVLIAISTSGNSENVLRAAKKAKEKGMTVIGLTGSSGGKLLNHSDLILKAPSDITSHIQEMHITLIHILAEIAPRVIIATNLGLYQKIKGLEDVPSIAQRQNVGLNFKRLKVPVKNGYEIAADLVFTDKGPAKGTIVCLHGIRANKEHFIPLAKRLNNAQYNTVMVDLKAHGESGGRYCSFGFDEKQDLQDLLQYLKSEEGLSAPVGIWAQSLGAAIGLQAMAIEPGFEFAVLESTYAKLDDTVDQYAVNYTGFNFPPLTKFVFNRMQKIGGFDGGQCHPVDFAKSIDQPVLLVHGDKDDRIKPFNANLNFDALSTGNKDILWVDGANHYNVWKTGGEQYFATAIEFIRDQTKTE